MRKVLILGGDSDYNLGDAAILAALCARFSAAGASEIVVTSSRASPRLPAGATTVIRRGFAGTTALTRAALAADLIVIGGGGLLQDDDSRVKMPYWASRIAALRLVNRNLVGHSVGAGPLEHIESRIAARFTCSTLASITVRDQFAQAALRACTHLPIDIVPDPAFMLVPAEPAAADRFLASIGIEPGRPIIGLALRKWFHARGGFVPARVRLAMGLRNDTGDAALSRLLAQLASALTPMAKQMNASILLLPTYSAVYENDAEICTAFARLVHGCEVRMASIDDPALYKAVTGRLSFLVSSRMHPLILAAGMGTPLVGLAYNGNFEGMFDMLGIPRRMIWLDEVAEDLPATLQRLIEQALNANDRLQQRATRLADLVSQKTAALLHESVALQRAA
jgi:polysaccharide pyruvyl transferase WcaK-like protein